jgi:hypothetical protein
LAVIRSTSFSAIRSIHRHSVMSAVLVVDLERANHFCLHATQEAHTSTIPRAMHEPALLPIQGRRTSKGSKGVMQLPPDGMQRPAGAVGIGWYRHQEQLVESGHIA